MCLLRAPIVPTTTPTIFLCLCWGCTTQDAPITLEGLQLLLSRESAAEPPQTYLISFNSSEGDKMQPHEQRITDFPHPYPQVRGVPCGSSCVWHFHYPQNPKP